MINGIQNTGQTGASVSFRASRKTVAKSTAAKNTQATDTFERKQQEVVRTGFGKGTISPPAAALRTLGRGLQSARGIVPTVEEVRDNLRASAAERRETRAQEVRDQQARSEPVAVTNGAAQFIQGMNQAAGTAQARIAGEDPQSTTAQATITIRGQAQSYLQVQRSETAATPSLNLLA